MPFSFVCHPMSLCIVSHSNTCAYLDYVSIAFMSHTDKRLAYAVHLTKTLKPTLILTTFQRVGKTVENQKNFHNYFRPHNFTAGGYSSIAQTVKFTSFYTQS